MKQITAELHAPIKKVKVYRKIISERVNEIFSIDLVEMQQFEKENDGYKYILNCVDIYSRYAFCVPMKSKTGLETSKALEKIIKSASSPPEKIWTDEGKEFYNKNVDTLRNKYNIDIYSTYGVAHSAIVERFNRTLKSEMYKYFTEHGTRRWIDIIDTLVKNYNKKTHRTLKKSPLNVYKNEPIIESNFIDDRPETKANFKVGDRVRVSYKRGVFDKGYLVNWSYEIFKINDVLQTRPITYKLIDEFNEVIKGSFYNEELKKTNAKENIYLVEKILQTKTVKGKKKHLVKFIGYSDKYNEWLDDKDIAHDLKDIGKLHA